MGTYYSQSEILHLLSTFYKGNRNLIVGTVQLSLIFLTHFDGTSVIIELYHA